MSIWELRQAIESAIPVWAEVVAVVVILGVLPVATIWRDRARRRDR